MLEIRLGSAIDAGEGLDLYFVYRKGKFHSKRSLEDPLHVRDILGKESLRRIRTLVAFVNAARLKAKFSVT